MRHHAGGQQSSAQLTTLNDLANAAAALSDPTAAPEAVNVSQAAGRSSVGSIIITGSKPGKQATKQTTINFQTKDRQAADMAVAYFLYEHALPFNVVEGGSFTRLVKALQEVSACPF